MLVNFCMGVSLFPSFFFLSLCLRKAGIESKRRQVIDPLPNSFCLVKLNHIALVRFTVKSRAEVWSVGTNSVRIKGLIVCFLEVGLLAAAITPSVLLSPNTANQHALIAVAFSSSKIIPLNTKSCLSISTDSSQLDQLGSLSMIGLSYCYDLFKFRAFSRYPLHLSLYLNTITCLPLSFKRVL